MMPAGATPASPRSSASRLRFQRIAKSHLWGGIACALLFLLLGCLFVDYAGIQTDEALFACPLFQSWQFFSIPFGHYNLPLMTMSYNGTLKTWLYGPILLPAGRPTAALIRVPAILMGAATIVIFWGLLCRAHSRRAAWIGCILLATDASFLLTTVHDWGPVALQHLLLVAAMFYAVRWFETAASRSLVAAAFFCGLALWDKAVFMWVFTGILAGSLLFASGIRHRLTWRCAAIAAGALGLGAMPLIVYNLATGQKFATIRSNANPGSGFASGEIPGKLRALRATANGSILFSYLVNEDWAPHPKSARSKLERVSFFVRDLAGERRRNNMTPAYCGALLLVPLLWRTSARKIILFCLVAIVVAWVFMVSTGGGRSAHHAVLLWPLPQLFLAVALAEAALRLRYGKWVLGAVVGFLAVCNILVINQYLYQFIRNGASDIWTDAIYPLADGLRRTDASQIVLPDWGLTESLCVLNRDKPITHPVGDPFLAEAHSPSQKRDELQTLSDRKGIWVEHVPGHEVAPGVDDRIIEAAHRAGFEPMMLQTYYDRNGRAIFQTLRFTSKSPK